MERPSVGNELLKVDRRGHVRVPRVRREALLDEYERCGSSAAEFAAHIGVKYSTFCHWKRCRDMNDPWFWEKYQLLHDYSFSHFADPEHGGEWIGLLDRTGRPINHAKGSNRKCCYHIGRNFLWASKLAARFPTTTFEKYYKQ